MPLVNFAQIDFSLFVRFLIAMAGACLACLAWAEDPDPLELERAVQLETAAGDVAGAEHIYKKLIQVGGAPLRTRAEATYRLADLYTRQAKNAEAKTLFLQLLRDFPEASDLIPLAELELTKVTALLTRDQIGTNVASMQHLGDLSIALQGALENGEMERATSLLQLLNAALEGLASGSDAPEVLVRLKISANEIHTTLHDSRGNGMVAALAKLTKSKDFEPFLQRGFPSDPHDVFAPAWRMKDRLARAIASNSASRVQENAHLLERYLAPLTTLPQGMHEGALARMISFASHDARELAAAGKFSEARKRLDEFDAERYEQFPNFRLVGTFSIRMPEPVVAAAWVILYRAELARRDLSRRAYATAMDHVTEAANVCREALPRVENSDAAALFKTQLDALETALWEIRNDRLGPAQQALKRVSEKTR